MQRFIQAIKRVRRPKGQRPTSVKVVFVKGWSNAQAVISMRETAPGVYKPEVL